MKVIDKLKNGDYSRDNLDSYFGEFFEEGDMHAYPVSHHDKDFRPFKIHIVFRYGIDLKKLNKLIKIAKYIHLFHGRISALEDGEVIITFNIAW